MFKATKQIAYIKGFKEIQAGSFKNDRGEDVAFDGYKQVTLCVYDKNNNLIDVKCRLPNTTEGENLYVKMRNLAGMTRVAVDVEIQISQSGNAKYFITGFELSK